MAAGVLALFLGACTDDEPRSRDPLPSAPITIPARPEPVGWDLEAARVDRVPTELSRTVTALPRSFPADDAALPDLRSDPPDRAVLAYHPREWFEGSSGWASERVFLLGVDGRWRSLELGDLGLPESAWPGPDTYGAGELSPDGRLWAGRSNDGVVLVDLGTGLSRHVAIPGSKYSAYAAWRADGSRLDVVQYLRGGGGRTTWTIDPGTDEVRRSARRLPLLGRSLRTLKRLVAQGVPRDHVEDGAFVGPTYTLLRLRRSVLAVDGTTSAPVARLRSGVLVHAWLDGDRLLVSHGPSGLVVWDVGTGAVELVTRVRPRTGVGRYWSASVATDLLGAAR